MTNAIIGEAPPRINNKRISKKLRAQILSVDGLSCAYCGHVFSSYTTAYDEVSFKAWVKNIYPTVDHAVPTSRGGSNDHENLVPACSVCNSQKGSKTAEEYLTWLEGKK